VALVALQLLTGAFNLVAGIEPAREQRRVPEHEESSMSTYLAWAAAVGAAGCGRCATAV
jgi:hypothetical protein